MHVVSDLDQVVELDTILDHRVFERAAVDAGVGANFHIVANAHRAELFDLFPLARMRRKTKTIGANHHAGVHDAALAHLAALPHRHPTVQDRARADARASFHHAQRADHSVRRDLSLGVDNGRGVDAVAHRQRVFAPPQTAQA